MRCKECNVDLGETYTKCPLCGKPASTEKALLPSIQTAVYPVYDPKPKKDKYSAFFPQKIVLRAVIPVCIGSGVAALCGFTPLWKYAAPVLCGLTAAFYAWTGLKEKGKLCHSAGALFCTGLLQIVCTILGCIPRLSANYFAPSMILTALAYVVLCSQKRRETAALFQAMFHR